MTLLLHAVSPVVNDYVTTFQSFRAFFTDENMRWFLKPQSLLLVTSTRDVRDELSFTFQFLSAVLLNPIFMTVSVFTLLLIFLLGLCSLQTDRSDQFFWCR